MILPLKNYCLLKKEKHTEEVKIGDIVIAEKTKSDSNEATIIEVGDEVKNPLLKQGNKVIYKTYSTTDYKIGDEEYLLVKDEDILAVIK